MKVLIIEDNPNLIEVVSLCLQLRWPDIEISCATDGYTGIKSVNSEYVDLVLLDINLPDILGFDVLKIIRSFSDVPVIILTVRGKEEEKVRGLETGADDYIVKPFKPRDLIARINSVLRRVSISQNIVRNPFIVQGKIALNLSTNEVQLGEQKVKLTPNETRVLYTLMSNVESTLSSELISKGVWGDYYKNSDRVRTYIRRLRNKLKDSHAEIIRNERGEGYRFISPV